MSALVSGAQFTPTDAGVELFLGHCSVSADSSASTQQQGAENLSWALQGLHIAVVMYVVNRLLASVGCFISRRLSRAGRVDSSAGASDPAAKEMDVYIILSTPNIFLWAALAHGALEALDDAYTVASTAADAEATSHLRSVQYAVQWTMFWAVGFFFAVPVLDQLSRAHGGWNPSI